MSVATVADQHGFEQQDSGPAYTFYATRRRDNLVTHLYKMVEDQYRENERVFFATVFNNPERFEMSVSETNTVSEMAAAFGLFRDIEVSDRELDLRFMIRANNVKKVRGVLADDALRRFLKRKRGTTNIKVLPAMRRPLSRLVMRVSRDLERAVAAYETTLEAVCWVSAPRAKRDRLLLELGNVPVNEIHNADDVLLWDGPTVRVSAVRELAAFHNDVDVARALVHTMDDDDPNVAHAAFESLRKNGGHEDVADELVTLLGRYYSGRGDREEHESLVTLLDRLGAGPTARAFQAIMAGERGVLEEIQKAFFDEVVAALVLVVRDGLTVSATHAAWALGELGAERAEEVIRWRAARLVSTDPEDRRALDEAIARLEAAQRLPRGATRPDDDLPRPASGSGTSAPDLPRASKKKKR